MPSPSARPSRGRGRGLLALAGVLALLLSACTGIPRGGGVHAGQADIPGDDPAPVFLPSGPQNDAGMEDILRGFIDAASSPDGNYDIARDYLTPAYSDDWNPDTGVTVDDGTGRSFTVLDEQTIQFSVRPVAEVDASGQYREIDSSEPVPLPYSFVRVGGQWRISSAPNGTVIDATTFSDVFSEQALYYFDPSFTWLVPDLRWFPRGASAPTKIVRAVLAGPSSWLGTAVTTAFPQGTALTADAVRVVGRDAQVDLNSQALGADRVDLQRMQAQLAASLPAGTSVTITIDQNSQEIGDLGQNAPITNPRVDARALILHDGEFGLLAASGDAITPLADLSEAVVALDPTAVTVAAGHRRAAVLTAAGVYAVAAGQDPVLLDSRPGLIAPSIDSEDFVWTVPAAQPNDIVVYDSAGAASSIESPWPEATAITSLTVSRDGTRLVALLSTATETRFVVAAIERSAAAPVGLGAPLLLATNDGVPLDATWIDELTVASLTRLPSGEERIMAQRIGGESIDLDAPDDTLTIVGSNSVRDLRALTADGSLTVQRGVGWQERLGAVGLLATQQGIGG
ncbi:hypothetical protein D6T64_14105 [Cryobacterium melibiosiphilum]|uniref:GerMN domain-containing protein n=1 Tax=Cryobacterium melibiosiphilum TaxID=995039 RepID=A0A3A5MHR1_9MICO|nr:LpqB family beta-propeller domain-containing protein [Cryobacterium melibiosiphilum]RJT87449.1 hypothetical protein D6T64_14105 [Cryobacterium melibiosiphilum]